MASAFQFNAFQNNAFQIEAVPAVVPRGDDGGGHRHRPVFVYFEDEPPDPIVAPVVAKRRKISRKAVSAAVTMPWAGEWSIAEAMASLPKTVPVGFAPPLGFTAHDVTVIAVAMWLAEEARRREDEDEIELLLLAA